MFQTQRDLSRSFSLSGALMTCYPLVLSFITVSWDIKSYFSLPEIQAFAHYVLTPFFSLRILHSKHHLHHSFTPSYQHHYLLLSALNFLPLNSCTYNKYMIQGARQWSKIRSEMHRESQGDPICSHIHEANLSHSLCSPSKRLHKWQYKRYFVQASYDSITNNVMMKSTF